MRPREEYGAPLSENETIVMIFIQLNEPGNKLASGTKEGLIAFLSIIATFEATAQILKESQDGSLLHIERAVREGGGMLGAQVALGNYERISKAKAGYEWTDYQGGYYRARYPMDDDSLKVFCLLPVVNWIVERVRNSTSEAISTV